MGVIAKGIPRGCQGLFTPVPLGYPLSVFNKNSTLKDVAIELLAVWQHNKLKTKNQKRNKQTNKQTNNPAQKWSNRTVAEHAYSKM